MVCSHPIPLHVASGLAPCPSLSQLQIVIHEYIPVCHKLEVSKFLIVFCTMFGMIIMWLSILLLAM